MGWVGVGGVMGGNGWGVCGVCVVVGVYGWGGVGHGDARCVCRDGWGDVCGDGCMGVGRVVWVWVTPPIQHYLYYFYLYL